MTEQKSRPRNRRKALQDLAGFGALAGLVPLAGKFADEQSPMSLFPSAFAQSVKPGQAKAAFISGAQTTAVNMAEWEPPPAAGGGGAEGGRTRIAHGDGPVGRAPETAGRYTAKAFDYPGGSLRVLTWKQGQPVFHAITYETEILVLQGSVELSPPVGLPGPTAKLGPGDALFHPSGFLRGTATGGDTVLLQAFVHSTAERPKRSIVYAKDAPETKPEGAAFTVKRYAFDGNSMRHVKLPKGTKTNPATPTRSDVIIYIAKGRMRRTEGSETFEVVAGDSVREILNVPGYWEVLEDSEFISTDAPLKVEGFNNAMIAKTPGVRLFSMLNDDNGRSHLGFADVPMKKVSDTESISAPQPGLYWRVGPRGNLNPHSRTQQGYTSNTGPYELHVGGDAHFTGCMAGNIESTLQDGSVLRRTAGEFCYITPGALHHSNFKSLTPAVYFNLYIPGGDEATGPLKFET